MKPIEPGCLAIIINSFTPENIGKTVRCLELLSNEAGQPLPSGLTTRFSTNRRWSVITPDRAETLEVPTDKGFNVIVNSGSCREDWLMRIGDDNVQDVLKRAIENSFQNMLKKEAENVQ